MGRCRWIALAVAAIALVMFVGQPAFAEKAAAEKGGKTHEGTVVKAGDGKLTMKSEGKEHTHDVAPNAKITCDGKECKLSDLKEGYKVKVTTTDDLKTATRIEATKSTGKG
jgi:hypothetical protein